MARNSNQGSSKANSKLTAISVVLIAAVLVLSVIALYPIVKSRVDENAKQARMDAIRNGEQPATIEYAANEAGKSVEDFLADFGYKVGEDGLDAQTEATELKTTAKYLATQKEMTYEDFLTEYGLNAADFTETTPAEDVFNAMSVEKYCQYNELEVDDYLSGLTDKVSKDTIIKDMAAMTVSDVIGEETFNSLKEQGTFDNVEEGTEIKIDMTWADFCEALGANAYVMPQYLQMTTTTETADAAAATDEAAADDTAEAADTADNSAADASEGSGE